MKLHITISKSVGIKANTHEGFCSWNMLQGHAPGAKLLRLYQRVHGYTSSSWIITEMNHPTWFTPCSWPLKGGTPGNLWWGCAAQFSKSWPYFIPKNVIFHTRLLTRSLKSRSILAGWPYLACSRLSDSGGDSPVSYRFISVFALSQLGGPNYLVAWNMNRLGLIRQKLWSLPD